MACTLSIAIAYPILKRRNIPFSVFVNTAVLDNKNLLWLHLLGYLFSIFGVSKTIDRLNRYVSNPEYAIPVGIDAGTVEHFIRKHIEYYLQEGVFGSVKTDFNINAAEISESEKMYLSWPEIEELCNNGASVYSHTHQHLPLNALGNADIMKNEIDTALEILSRSEATGDRFISFPFGMEVDYGRAARSYAYDAGHEFVVEVGNGINSHSRIKQDKILSRVNLGSTGQLKSELYSAIELIPVVKTKLKSLRH